MLHHCYRAFLDGHRGLSMFMLRSSVQKHPPPPNPFPRYPHISHSALTHMHWLLPIEIKCHSDGDKLLTVSRPLSLYSAPRSLFP